MRGTGALLPHRSASRARNYPCSPITRRITITAVRVCAIFNSARPFCTFETGASVLCTPATVARGFLRAGPRRSSLPLRLHREEQFERRVLYERTLEMFERSSYTCGSKFEPCRDSNLRFNSGIRKIEQLEPKRVARIDASSLKFELSSSKYESRSLN